MKFITSLLAASSRLRLFLTPFCLAALLHQQALALPTSNEKGANETPVKTLHPQTISFGALPAKTVGDAPFQLVASASSGLPIRFTVDGPATLSGTQLSLTGAGTVTITANQAGNGIYAAAAPVVQSFIVSQPASGGHSTTSNTATTINTVPLVKQTPNVTWNIPSTLEYTGKPMFLSGLCQATADVGGSITYSPATTTVLTAGTHTLTMSYVPGDTKLYNSVTKTATITVTKAAQTITFVHDVDKQYGPQTWGETGIASSNLPVTYSISGPVKIISVGQVSPCLVTLGSTGVGHVVIVAHQPGNENYLPAPDSTFEFNVIMGAPAITWNTPAAIASGTALSGEQLNATADIPGSFNYQPAAGTVITGSTDIRAYFTPTDPNYGGKWVSVHITVK